MMKLFQSALEMPDMTAGPSISPEAENKEELVQTPCKASCKEAAKTLLKFMENQDDDDCDYDYVDLLQICGYI
jgi:hypothetical protein